MKRRPILLLLPKSTVAAEKKQKEMTSSGPSMIHFGHFIAGSQDPDIAAMDATLSCFPFLTGYSPHRWRKGLDVMIPKRAGLYNVEKLRAILLYECDYNMGNKRIGRITMARAEAFRMIAMEQYGGRHFLSAIDHCFNKRLSFDLFRQKRLNGALLCNDAKSCYDRIVHSVAILCMRRAGIPKEALHCMFSTIQNLIHNVRTIYGDSVLFFLAKDLDKVVIQGCGQGNGAGPPMWTMISTVILDMLRAAGYGIKFQSALSSQQTNFAGFAFVDDTDLITSPGLQSDYKQTTPAEIVSTAQGGADMWEGGIRASGGALEPSKSFWVMIHFAWQGGKWHYSSPQEAPGDLFIRDATGTQQKLLRLPVDHAE